jgi:16S rRNA processing protein RimM
MDEEQLITIGKITGVHGLVGNFKVWPFAESLQVFSIGSEVRLKPEKPASAAPLDRVFTISKFSPKSKGILLGFKEVGSREAAEKLVSCEILVTRASLPELDEDTWYWNDLYGLKVQDSKLGSLGEVESIFPTGANDILVVKDSQTGKETLIPIQKEFVESVDLENKIIQVTLPEGLSS